MSQSANSCVTLRLPPLLSRHVSHTCSGSSEKAPTLHASVFWVASKTKGVGGQREAAFMLTDDDDDEMIKDR